MKTIGWAEYVDYPEWDISAVKAKIDTGARTSALHVENLEILPGDLVRFDVVCGRRRPFTRQTVTTPIVKWARVRSSSGHYQKRCFVNALLRLGGEEFTAELSLVSREKMLFRMLLGRKALQHRFLVDVSKRLLQSSRPPRPTPPA
ncbi:MAG: ATP-dependent zinc protease [Verrucomicrobiales bacterium]|nr:ATP-dependent zinc protease [Verrucomicrobiales bacterium]